MHANILPVPESSPDNNFRYLNMESTFKHFKSSFTSRATFPSLEIWQTFANSYFRNKTLACQLIHQPSIHTNTQKRQK